MTLREVVAQLLVDAEAVRDVRQRLRQTFQERYYLEAEDIEQGLARVADAIQLIAGDAARLANQVGEPVDATWMTDAAPGELMELYGK